MTNYIITKKATEDLAEIWNYTYKIWSERQADNYYNMIVESFQDIVNNPQTGKKYHEIAKNLFGLKIGRHIIFYISDLVNKPEIIRILHEQMDLKSRLLD